MIMQLHRQPMLFFKSLKGHLTRIMSVKPENNARATTLEKPTDIRVTEAMPLIQRYNNTQA